MKTIDRLVKEIVASEDLKIEFDQVIARKDKEALEAFLKNNGCDASAEEFRDYCIEKRDEVKSSRELSDAELEQIAGGTGPEFMLIFGALITLSCFICD